MRQIVLPAPLAADRRCVTGQSGNNQVDTECTEFARSFTEKKFRRFAQAVWFVGRFQRAAKKAALLSLFLPSLFRQDVFLRKTPRSAGEVRPYGALVVILEPGRRF